LIKSKEEALETVRARVNPYIEMKNTQTAQIVLKQTEIANLNTEIAKLADDHAYISFYIEGFKKIKLLLFDDLVNRLNELSQEYLSRYTSELSVKVSCERQTKTGTRDELFIEVEKPEGAISYAAYSGGERQKIKLSVSLALAQVIEEMCDRDCNTIFFDEPNNGLDNIGKRSNFEVFSDIAAQGKAVIVIDHDAYFQDSFNNVVTAVKENGYSRLE
jgi:DNA repair exonuclease SbcCD ATPase subunit